MSCLMPRIGGAFHGLRNKDTVGAFNKEFGRLR